MGGFVKVKNTHRHNLWHVKLCFENICMNESSLSTNFKPAVISESGLYLAEQFATLTAFKGFEPHRRAMCLIPGLGGDQEVG